MSESIAADPSLLEGALVKRVARAVAVALVVALGAASAGRADAGDGEHLGVVDFPVSCSEPARAEFNRAVALLHHMTYPQARAAFGRVAAIDSGCAMAHWGTAMTLFQPLWPTRPGPAELARGWEAVVRAELLHPPTERERLFVAAASAFFREPSSRDYWSRIRRWEQAMEGVYAAFPDDPEAAAFYALAHLATAPSDSLSLAHAEKAAGILLGIYERNPDHPGAMHYLVHANDAPGREHELLEITRRYEQVAPRNPHALHMPTHIYTRLGDWEGVVRGNLRAAEAALEYPAGDEGQYVWDEFPHALEYLLYAELQQGADEAAAATLARLLSTADLEPTFKTAFHLASMRARFALERRAWGEAARIVPREPAGLDWDRFAWPEAITWFARGLGAAHLGDLETAGAAVERLAFLEANTREAGEALFARNIRMLRLELEGWTAHAAGRETEGVEQLREAAELEAATPKHAVTPGPTLPARELLGDLLLAQQRPAEALAEYRLVLQSYPRRFNGLLGAARAARAVGERDAAGEFARQLLEIADATSMRPVIAEVRALAAVSSPGDLAACEREMLRLETVWNDAHLAGDVDALDRLWSPELVVEVPEMPPFSKEQLLTMWHTSKVAFASYATSDLLVRCDESTALVTGRLLRTRDFSGRVRSEDWRFTKTYARRDGVWSVVAYKASPTPSP